MTCIICTEKINTDAEYLPCFHKFHIKCISKWVNLNPSCPVCRFKLTKSDSHSHSHYRDTIPGTVVFDPSQIENY